jgi:Fur family transcriptional regulator, ferric uptake regulator
MSDDVHATIEERLRRARQRYTAGRRDLVDSLLRAGRPVTIPELDAHGATQSQSSLYRNLAVLEQCGAVHRLASTDELTRYELTEELSEHHHHVVCTHCGRLEDVVLPPAIEQSLRAAADSAAAQHDFRVEEHRLELIGACQACA